MAVSSVLGPDGKTYTLEHPDGASQEDIFKFVHQSTQVKPEPAKPGVVGNVVRGIPAGAAAAGYDVLGAIGTMAYEGLGKYAKRGADPEYVEKIDQAVRGAQEKVAEYTFDIGATAGEAFGVDEGRFSADVGRGLGQLPLMVVTAGMASVPMSFAEVIKDAEQSLGVKYYEMPEEEKAKVAATGAAYAAFSLAADRIGLKYMGLSKLDKFFDGSETVKGSVVKDVLTGALGEGLTETSQAVVKDQLARVYDDDREYNLDSIKEYLYEGAVGATVGGIASTGTTTLKQFSGKPGTATTDTKKEDLKKPVKDRPALEIPRDIEVEYKELDGQVRIVPIAVGKDEDVIAVAEEALRGRYDEKYGITVTETTAPQPIEVVTPEVEPDVTAEEVPVQPEAAVEPVVEPTPEAIEDDAFPALPEQSARTQLEFDPFADPEPEQEELFLPSRSDFRISPRMAKSTPRWRGAEVNYSSDLELASYIASGKGKNAGSVRSELIEAGYSPAEIDSMGKDVRSQMRKQYNAGRPISVKIGPDVTAEASGVDRRTMSFKDVTKRTPEIQEQAKILRENIKAGDREQSRAVARAADEFKPVHAYDFVPEPETNSEMRNALKSDQVEKLNKTFNEVEDGGLVSARLDIPAYRDFGAWIVTLHTQLKGFKAGKTLGYQSTSVLNKVTLGLQSDLAAASIAAGGAKGTIATIKGNLKKVTPTQAKKMADKALKDPSYVQVGMDPERRGYFYNRETMQEVVAGDQAIQIGPLVLVKNPKYGATPSNEWLSLGQDVVAEEGAGLTEQEIKDGQEGEQGLVADTPVTGDVVADAAEFKPSRPVSVPNAPVISRSSLRGKSGFIYFSDRTRVGTYTGLNPDSNISIPLQGGMGYAFIPKNVEAEAGWAFTSDNIFTRFRDKVNETDGIGYVALYTKENLRANGTFLLAYIAEVKYALASGSLTKADFQSEINGLRERFLAKKVKDKDFISRDVDWYSLWNKKWKTPEDLQAALDAAGFETRAAAFSAKKATTKNAKPGDLSGGQLASKRSVKKGMPDVIKMIDLFVEPDLADRKRGEIVGAVQFQKDQDSAVVASDIGSDEHLSYPLVIKGRGIGVFDSTVNVLDVIKTQKEKNQALRSAETSFPTSSKVGDAEVTAEATQPEVEDRGPQDTFDNGGQVMDFVESTFNAVAKKVGVAIRPAMGVNYTARYNATQQVIEYNPMALLNRSKSGVKAAMREEIIHASMHQVLMQKATKGGKKVDPGEVWVNFFDAFAKTLTAQERVDIGDVYQNLTTYSALGAEYSRAVVQNLLYGEFSEQYVMQSKGGPAWNRIVDLLRSVQAYMAKVLGPMRKTNPEAAQVIVDSVELLKAADPDARPKNQQVVAEAYDTVDNNTAKENTEAGESVDKKASERIREERKWWSESSFRKTASKYLTPIITRLNRINPKFGRILQGLDTAIRERSFGYRKQTEAFFNKLNAVKGAEFQELKQLIYFSPTPEEANLPSNKAKMQRRDALLHKHGLLNMYRLDVQPIFQEIYAEYTELGMPRMGYLEQYFSRTVKDLEGLIKSYGHKTKRTFELLVREENLKRAENKDADGNADPLPEMADSERARFFQDFLQNKFRVDINGARLPGNIKVREINFIDDDKLKYYDDPGVAFGKYTTNMSRAIESFKVVGDTRKGRLQGTLGLLTEKLFSEGQIDQADADEVKTLTELITAQFATENEILKSLGTLTYMATLINPGPVLVQIMDLYKVALYRGLGGVLSGTYRTITGNRRFDIEKDFSIAKTQLSAEFEDPSVLQKALDFGLSRLVPFRQMDTAMKHASIEAAYDDFVKKAKAPVGSKKYEQLLRELTITMGREDALKTISDLKLDKAMDSALVKEALLSELLQRQPLTYLQVPEGYQTDPSKRLFYKLSTFMLLDLNYNRQEFMNDLGGPGKTLKQRTVALRRLAYMATLLTMFGLPSDMLDDWISGKDTYIPEHVMNNMLGMFGLSKYTTTRALEKGTVESVIQRFTPPAINIMIKGESSLRSWVKGDTELFEMKAWQNAPLSDVWYYRTGAGKESQRKYRKKQRKEGITPTIPRS